MRRAEAERLQSTNLTFCAKLKTFRQLFFRRSRCTIHSDHPTIAVTRADQRARNNWDFDPQGIECNSDACGMDSLDSSFKCLPASTVTPTAYFPKNATAACARLSRRLQSFS